VSSTKYRLLRITNEIGLRSESAVFDEFNLYERNADALQFDLLLPKFNKLFDWHDRERWRD